MKYRLPFDDHIKERLGDYSPAVPDHIWENIKKKKEKKRPFVFFYSNTILLILGCFLAGGAFTYFLLSNNNKKTFNFSQQNNHSQSLQFSAEKIKRSNAAGSIAKIVAPNKQFNNIPQNPDAVHSNVIVENDVNHPSSSVYINATSTSFKNNSAAKNINADWIDSRATRIKKEQPSQNNIADAAEKVSVKRTDNTSTSITKAYAIVDNTSIATESEKYSTTTNSAVTAISKQSPAISTLNMFRNPAALMTLQQNPNIRLRLTVAPQLNIPCPVNQSKSPVNKSYIELYGSVDYILRQFKDTPNSTYLKSRKESTSFASAYSTGLRYTKVFNNGLNIRVGLNYSQINEKFKFVQGNIVQVVFIINAAGDTIGSYQTTSTRYKTSYNHYKTLDIPVTLGYETQRGKWNMNFNTGLIFNIHSWNQGEVLNESLQPVDISGYANSPYEFKTNIGIGGIVAGSVYYSLNGKWSIMGEPYLRYNFSSMNKTDITLKQKYHTSGIKFGVRLNL